MNRRQFLALSGAATPGLWLAGAGFVQLPRRMIIVLAGQCSFCDESAEDLFGLAGVTDRPARICNECIEACLVILGDCLSDDGTKAPPPVAEHRMSTEVSEEFEVTEMLRLGWEPRTGAELAALMKQVRRRLNQSETKRERIGYGGLSCSFCGRQSQIRKTIGCSRANICDVCTCDAAALISMHSYRHGV